MIPHDRRLTADQVAAESGVDLELAKRLRRAMGLPDVPDGEAAFFDADVEALKRAKILLERELVGTEQLLHMARNLGLAAARMAEAVVGAWWERFTEEPVGAGDERLDPQFGADRIEELERVIGYLFRRHLLDSVTRRLSAAEAPDTGAQVAVGFADLVGFTSLSEQLSDRETGELVERFEVLASDRVVLGEGRIVKMIGDEVMFAAEPANVGEIALSLADTFSDPDLPSVRVGVAAGTVVAQGGDLFGPVVNLAHRATMAARPGSVLISASLAEIVRADPRYRVNSIRPRRLKGLGVVPLYALRRA